ncbi:hypothetical protein DM43_4620 [Burkholderia cepacia]|uniref:Uncharacterized protein n=1 Tax=Burkholderia cepacia TaxID=292 RepID=A0AA88Z6A9_BURCE|nr:hypothetical protein DM43_4620 [Burkholderia cepacia]
MERNAKRLSDVSVPAPGPFAMPEAGSVFGLDDRRDRQVIAGALRALLRERCEALAEALAFAMRAADPGCRAATRRAAHHGSGAPHAAVTSPPSLHSPNGRRGAMIAGRRRS